MLHGINELVFVFSRLVFVLKRGLVENAEKGNIEKNIGKLLKDECRKGK